MQPLQKNAKLACHLVLQIRDRGYLDVAIAKKLSVKLAKNGHKNIWSVKVGCTFFMRRVTWSRGVIYPFSLVKGDVIQSQNIFKKFRDNLFEVCVPFEPAVRGQTSEDEVVLSRPDLEIFDSAAVATDPAVGVLNSGFNGSGDLLCLIKYTLK